MNAPQYQLSLTAIQMELIFQSVEMNELSYQKSIDYHVKGDSNYVEDSNLNDVNFYYEKLLDLKNLLRRETAKISSNRVELLNVEYHQKAWQTIETFMITEPHQQYLAYVYNARGIDYYVFFSLEKVMEYFNSAVSPEYSFNSEAELDVFLRYLKR